MGSNIPHGEKPHIVLIPVLAQGHMIPMIDMAHLLADAGATVTLFTTPLNAARIKTIIDRVETEGIPIRFVSLRFPCGEAGLPEGSENLDTLPSKELLTNFVDACDMLQGPLLQHLREQSPKPSCIISDVCHRWSRGVAQEFGIPWLIFHGFGCLAILCRHIIHSSNILANITDENEIVVLPGLPQRIEMTKAQSPDNFAGPGLEEAVREMMAFESLADGVVVNSFDELENPFAECYRKTIAQKIWTIGPVFLYDRNHVNMAVRGNKASIDEKECLNWLDSMKPCSVVYVSFGSLACSSALQLVEIGLGLEASNYPFIWVINAGEKPSEVEDWLSEGFEERVSGRGLIIRGWAPQLIILSHPAVGGFVTHCGWNSTLESLSASVPMITWPHFADQFLNEKLIVQVLKIGVTMGVNTPSTWREETVGVLRRRDDIQKAVCQLMDEGEEGKEIRERVSKLGENAKKAMEGGSSSENVLSLIQHIKMKMTIEF